MSRLAYSFKNARVSVAFYLLVLALNFFSRRIFLEELGTQFVGLTSSVMSYIGFLNLADLGIATAVAQVLYAPLYRRDRTQITELVSLLGWLFRLVGLAITLLGLTFAAFIPWVFARAVTEGIPLGTIYAAYLTFLATTLMSYLLNYKQNLLMADQRGYVVTRIFNLSLLAKVLLQMALLRWTPAGYLSWLAVELLFGVVYAVWLESALRRIYPWLRSSLRQGRAAVRKYRSVFATTRRIFSHRIASLVLYQSDVIVLGQLISQSMVSYYTNYSMMIGRLTSFIGGALNNSYAGVGNLVVEGDRSKIKLVFWQFNAMYFWIGGTLSFSFYELVNPFISLWLPAGRYALFSSPVVLMLVATLFIGLIRQTAQYFLNAYGLYHDVWAAWTEAALNLVLSFWACWRYGVSGVVAGTLLSTGLFVLFWKPYFLYRRGFRESSREYWLTLLKYLSILVFVWLVLETILVQGWLPSSDTWGGWLTRAVIIPLLYGILSGVALYFSSRGMRNFVRLVTGLLRAKLRR